jgi:hypothetical protein
MSIRNSKSKILRTADGEKERERSIILTNGIIISSRIHMIDKQLPMQITRLINIGREPCYDFPITTAPRLSLSLRVDPERIHISFDWLALRERERVFLGRWDKSQNHRISSAKTERKTSSPATIFFSLFLSCLLHMRIKEAESSCWSDQTLLVTVGGIVCSVSVCNVVPFSFPLASLTLSLTLGSSRSRSHTSSTS